MEVGVSWGTTRSLLGVTWFESSSDFGSRLVPNVDGIFEDLQWLGIHWNEPALVQSQRTDVYAAALDKVETLAAFARDFGSRVMEMDQPLPVNMFTGSKLVNRSELAELEQLLHDWPVDKE